MEYELSVAFKEVVSPFAAVQADSADVFSLPAAQDASTSGAPTQDWPQGQEKYMLLEDGNYFSTEHGLFIAGHGSIEDTIAAYGGERDMLFNAYINSLAGDADAVWQANLDYNEGLFA